MNFPSNLLSIFAKHDGIQDPRDGVIGVPRLLSPVLELPEVLTEGLYGDNSTLTMRTSFTIADSMVNANAAAQQHGVLIGPGVWDLRFCWQYHANYTDLVNVGGGYIAVNVAGSGNDFQIAVMAPHSGIQVGDFYYRVAFAKDNALITWILNANGAGEEDRLDIGISANRLG